jgi:hypothetical protein
MYNSLVAGIGEHFPDWNSKRKARELASQG